MSRGVWWVCALMWVACSDSADPGASSREDAGVVEEDGDVVYIPYDDAGPDGICASCGGCEETQAVLSAQHKPEPISYEAAPPSGGDHASCWSSFGVHDEAVPEARWVHNLEHGAVVFLHNCPSDCDAEIAELTSLAKGRAFALVTSNARLPTRFAVVAWGVRLLSDCVDREAFAQFYEKHVDNATESTTSPPPGGC